MHDFKLSRKEAELFVVRLASIVCLLETKEISFGRRSSLHS